MSGRVSVPCWHAISVALNECILALNIGKTYNESDVYDFKLSITYMY